MCYCNKAGYKRCPRQFKLNRCGEKGIKQFFPALERSKIVSGEKLRRTNANISNSIQRVFVRRRFIPLDLRTIVYVLSTGYRRKPQINPSAQTSNQHKRRKHGLSVAFALIGEITPCS